MIRSSSLNFQSPQGRGQKKKTKKKMEISIFGFGPPPPPKDGKVEQKKTSFRVLMAFSPIIGIKDGKSKKKKFRTPPLMEISNHASYPHAHPLLSVALPGELWPVGPLRTQHVNFQKREIESFAEVQNILLNWPIGSSGSSSRIKFEPLIKEN